jgi:hypothetical protein
LLDGGMSYEDLASLAISVAGQTTFEEISKLLWTNVIGSAPSAEDIAPFVTMLELGQLSIGSLTTLAADTDLNAVNIDLVGLSQTGLAYLALI